MYALTFYGKYNNKLPLLTPISLCEIEIEKLTIQSSIEEWIDIFINSKRAGRIKINKEGYCNLVVNTVFIENATELELSFLIDDKPFDYDSYIELTLRVFKSKDFKK